MYGEKLLCIGDCRFDFQAVSHNTVKLHQPFNIFVGHLCYKFSVEIAKSFAISLTFSKNGYPTQSGLGTLQHKKLKQRLVVGYQFSTLLIILFHIHLVSSAPTTASVYYILHNHNIYSILQIYGKIMSILFKNKRYSL